MGRCNALRFQAASAEFKGLMGMHPWDSGEKDLLPAYNNLDEFLKGGSLRTNRTNGMGARTQQGRGLSDGSPKVRQDVLKPHARSSSI